jgi:ApeA N-terminal domain 1
MAKKFSIYDEFEIRGYWFLPSNPENQIAGILKYGLDGIDLQLFGTFTEKGIYVGETDKFDIVLGITEEGEITLHDGFQIRMKMTRITSTQLTFNKMLIGKHFSKKEEMQFHSADINYSNLEDWMGHNPFSDDLVMEEGKLTQAGMTYTFPSVFEAEVESIGATIKAGYRFNTSSELYRKKTFEHTSSLRIFPDDSQGLEWFLNITSELQNMLTLLMDRPVYPKRIIAKGGLLNKEKDIREKIEIFILPMREFQEKNIRLTDRYISFHLIKDNITTVLSNWFADEEMKSSRRIFLRNLYSESLDWENKFLDYAKSIESFHRDTSGDAGKFVPDETYKPIKQQMIEAVPADIDNNLKQKLNSTLKYAHHFGFERRVRETLVQLPAALRDLMFEDARKLKAFAGDVTKTRDYYTHIGEVPDYYYKEWGLFFANKRMHTVLYYQFCNRLGIGKDILDTVIMQNDSLVQWLKTAKQELQN